MGAAGGFVGAQFDAWIPAFTPMSQTERTEPNFA